MEEVRGIIHNILHNQNLLLMLPKEKWLLQIQIGSRSMTIALSRNGIEIQDNTNVQSELICSEEDWISIATGQCKLRQCIRLGKTKYKGSFRQLLSLEALLFLQAKIN